jgi:hypothetical protein
VVHKFNDLDADGQHDPAEPMLPGVRFDVKANDLVYPATTGPDGTLKMCFPEGSHVRLDELSRASGGLWTMTTDAARLELELSCGITDVWIGNTMLQLPRTGAAGIAGAVSQAGRCRLY